MPFSERRKYPRVAEAVLCRLVVGPEVLAVRTENLSCGGALCRLSLSIPSMTQLEISLELPQGGSSKAGQGVPVRCTGVVVRQERLAQPGGEASYRTAIFFSDITLEDRRRIAEFVLQSMLHHDRRRS